MLQRPHKTARVHFPHVGTCAQHLWSWSTCGSLLCVRVTACRNASVPAHCSISLAACRVRQLYRSDDSRCKA